MVREAKATGQTVFMSSHVMSEVQQTADRVGIIREGRLVAVERVEDLRERAVRRVEIHFDEPVAGGGVRRAARRHRRHRGRRGTVCAAGSTAARTRWSRPPPGTPWSRCLSEEPDLEELFFHLLRRGEGSDRVAA